MWPVVVVLEPILGLGIASSLLVQRFMRRMDRLIPQLYTTVHPVVFLQVEDLEVLAQHVRDGTFGLRDCLREKLGFDQAHFYSFHDFYFGQFVPERRLEFKRNSLIAERFAALSKAALARFEEGEYSGCALTAHGATFRRASQRQGYA